MAAAQIDDPTRRRPLRLWPGVVIAVLLLVTRFGVKIVIPGFEGFNYAMLGSFFFVFAFVVWWLFFSRAPWVERLGGIALMIAGLAATSRIGHESMGLAWLFAYAVPFMVLAFVIWAAASRGLGDGPRRLTMVATIVLACGVWSLMRSPGIDGDHNLSFVWRWAPTAEAEVLDQRATGSVARSPAADSAEVATDWPGFRGPGRDGIVHGVHIATSWSQTPPVELWRRPVGPGWSSFAVDGDRLYTQEQRGEDEVVVCYDATTGEPVWIHRDAVRFFESNAGAGPRGTPTLSGGLVVTLGATGILNVLDAADGAPRWTHDLSADTETKIPDWGFSSSPLVYADLAIAAAGGQLVAYDLATGDRRWTGAKTGGSYSSPQLLTIDGVAQVVQLSGKGVTSVAPGDGTVLWEHAWSGFPMVQPAMTADGDVLVSISQGAGTRRLSARRGAGGWTVDERWTSSGLKPYFNDFVVHRGHAYGFDGRILASIDLESGTRTWKGGRYGSGQLLLLADQDLLLVLSEAGDLALVRAAADGFTEIARIAGIEGKTWNHPVLVGDRLVVRNDQEMAAFRLPLAASVAVAGAPHP